ncbi:MAG: PAS domain-containing protein, partial [Thermosynechococcaceae cyanobacterium]
QNTARIFGVAPAEAANGPLSIFMPSIHPDDQELVTAALKRTLETGEDYNLEFRLVGSEGCDRWVVSRGQIEQNELGQAVMPGVVIDISAQRQAETRLRESEARFEQIADTMPQMVWVTRADGYTEYFNRRWYEFTGCSPEESLGENWSAPLHPDDLQKATDGWKQSVQSGEPYEIEYRFRSKEGEYRWFLGRALPVRDETGQITKWFGTCTDIEAYKRLAEERIGLVQNLRQFAADLSENDRRKDEFLATLAHELRNPLAPIRNGLEIMKVAEPNSETVERVQAMMERQLTQMVRLVDDLLDMSRISRGKIDLRRERVELSSIIEQAIETSRPLIDLAQHELTVTQPPQPIYLDADSVRIAQVISNLLTNASKYSEPGGQIWLTVEQQESEVIVSVKDTGIGLAPDMLPHVFDLFTQVDGGAVRSQGGLGIGLTLVKQLVEMHNGSVSADSPGLGQGSEFIIRLPILANLLTSQSPQNAMSEPTNGQTCRILIVDDNEDAAWSLELLFESTGDETRRAADGLAGFEAAAEFRPDIVLLDIGLPKLNGYEVARKIREQPWGKKMVLVALTGWGQEEDRRRSSEAGFDAHMVKPIEHAALLQLLDELLPNNP